MMFSGRPGKEGRPSAAAPPRTKSFWLSNSMNPPGPGRFRHLRPRNLRLFRPANVVPLGETAAFNYRLRSMKLKRGCLKSHYFLGTSTRGKFAGYGKRGHPNNL